MVALVQAWREATVPAETVAKVLRFGEVDPERSRMSY